MYIGTYIYYFDKPTIGICSECGHVAIYKENRGFTCPNCGSKKISIFIWDGNSPEPEI